MGTLSGAGIGLISTAFSSYLKALVVSSFLGASFEGISLSFWLNTDGVSSFLGSSLILETGVDVIMTSSFF